MRALLLAVLAVFAVTAAHAEPAPLDEVFARLEATGALDNPCFAISIETRVTACATRFYVRDLNRMVFSIEVFAADGAPREQTPYASTDGHPYERAPSTHATLAYIRRRLEHDHFAPFEPSFRDLSEGGTRIAGHKIARTGDSVTCDGVELWLTGLGLTNRRTSFAIAEPLPGVMLVRARGSRADADEMRIDSIDLANKACREPGR